MSDNPQNAPAVGAIVSRVAARMHLTALANRFCLFTLLAVAIYIAIVLAIKLLGLGPDVLTWWTVLLAPAIGAAAALLLYPRPSRHDAAHRIDQRMLTKDLFLTATMLDGAVGEYKPLVTDEARRLAPTIRPATIVPFAFSQRAGHMFAAIVAAALLTLVPQFDPFGFGKQREIQEQRERQLIETIKATETRKSQLERAATDSEVSPEVEQATQELIETFRQMRRDQRENNLARLREQQMRIGELYRQAGERRQLAQNQRRADAMRQQLGGTQNPEVRQAMQDLQQGDAQAVRDQLQELQKKIEEMMAETDEQRRQELAQEVQKQMQDLKNAAEQAGAQGLSDALDRAMQQMQMGGMEGMEGMQNEALQSALDSLQLSEMEAEQLAQMIRDQQSLADALDALQKAMQANQSGEEGLDGEQCEGAEAMAEFAELFEEMGLLAEGGLGPAEWQQDPQDGGGPRDEAPVDGMAHEDQRAPGRIQPGEMLASIKTRELTDRGEVTQSYRQAIQQIQQEVSAAVLSEDIPPSHRQAIQRYFDNLEQNLQAEPAGAD